MNFEIIINSVMIISAMGAVLGLGLGYAGKKFEVVKDPKFKLLRDALPGANCGGCGYVGCDAFADALIEGNAKTNGCPVGGDVCAKDLSNILGVEDIKTKKMVAFIKCNGTKENTQFKYEYFGLEDCNAASYLADGGAKSCHFGCLGYGNCLKSCEFDAISIKNGIAFIDKQKCTSCKKCIDTCPKKLIELVPYENFVNVVCNSNDQGKSVKKNCEIGCIGCKLCEKACNFDAIHVENNLAIIDYEKCTMCNECVKKCPTNAICSNNINI